MELHTRLSANLIIGEEDSKDEEDHDETWETDDEFEDATDNISPIEETEAMDIEMEDDEATHVETAEDRVRAALERTAAMFGPPTKPAKMVVLPDEAPQDHHFIRSTTQPLNGSFIGRVVKEQNILFSALPEGERLLISHPMFATIFLRSTGLVPLPTGWPKKTASEC